MYYQYYLRPDTVPAIRQSRNAVCLDLRAKVLGKLPAQWGRVESRDPIVRVQTSHTLHRTARQIGLEKLLPYGRSLAGYH